MSLSKVALLVAAGLAGKAVAVNNGLARTPQMGWVCFELAFNSIALLLCLKMKPRLIASYRTTGIRLVVLYLRISFLIPPRSLWNQAYAILDIIMSSWMTAGPTDVMKTR